MIRVSSHVSWSPVEGELALFDSRDGSYHALNASAAEIWRGIAGGTAPSALAGALAERHGLAQADVERDVAVFVEAALAKGLIEGEPD